MIYEGGKERIVEGILNHWGLDDRFTARTGFPVTLNGPGTFDPVMRRLLFRGVDLVPGQPVYLYGSNCTAILQGLGDLAPGKGCPGGRAINPLAFSNPSSSVGNAPRNFVSGFGAWQTDLAVRRDFPIRESMKLQIPCGSFQHLQSPEFRK